MHFVCKFGYTFLLFSIKCAEIFSIFRNLADGLTARQLMKHHSVLSGIYPCPGKKLHIFLNQFLFKAEFGESIDDFSIHGFG